MVVTASVRARRRRRGECSVETISSALNERYSDLFWYCRRSSARLGRLTATFLIGRRDDWVSESTRAGGRLIVFTSSLVHPRGALKILEDPRHVRQLDAAQLDVLTGGDVRAPVRAVTASVTYTSHLSPSRNCERYTFVTP
eukprot:1194369-Prorocentrum_minimum.AAC.1